MNLKPNQTFNTMEQLSIPCWSTTMLYHAMDWWQRNGSFDKDLYERIVQIKYNLEINAK
jgi:hypothetical protein